MGSVQLYFNVYICINACCLSFESLLLNKMGPEDSKDSFFVMQMKSIDLKQRETKNDFLSHNNIKRNSNLPSAYLRENIFKFQNLFLV